MSIKEKVFGKCQLEVHKHTNKKSQNQKKDKKKKKWSEYKCQRKTWRQKRFCFNKVTARIECFSNPIHNCR